MSEAGRPEDGKVEASGPKPGARDREGEKEKPSRLRSWADLVVRAGFWALVIYMFVFQVSVVHGRSMMPNFHEDDRLVIDKITCRIKEIERFDVIVFETVMYEERLGQYVRKDYIKRVIGLPGETVEIRDGGLFVDGERLKEDEKTLGCLSFGDERTWKIPRDRYFVLGDNRTVSRDSRMYIGLVSLSQIKGKVRIRFWPWDRREWY